MTMKHTPAEIQQRLEILRGKLEAEGMYVSANTVILAQELIRELTGVDAPAVRDTTGDLRD